MRHPATRSLYRPVQPPVQLSANLERRQAPRPHADWDACTRVARGPRLALLHREDAKAAQLDPISTHERVCNLIEHKVQNFFDLALVEKWTPSSDPLDQFRFDQPCPPVRRPS